MLTKREEFIPAGPRRRVRIVDLAEHLSLTKGTVSRALNGYSDISDATRIRVRKAAEELGYRPLSHAQAIRTGRVRSIGMIVEMYEHDGHRPFLADFLAGMTEAASHEDWTITVATASSEADTVRLLQELTDTRKADGFILPRTKLDDARIRYLREHEIPFVLFGRTGDEDGCAWFDIESEKAIAEAVERLVALGHRRIGFVPASQGYTFSKLRLDGYFAGMKAAGLEPDPALVASPAVSRAEGAASALELLRSDPLITALIYSVDYAALGAYDAARELGLKIGHNLSVISYDGIPEGAFIDPPLSTFKVDSRSAGTRLAEQLIRLCRGAAPEELRQLARAEFLDRQSHGPVPSEGMRAPKKII